MATAAILPVKRFDHAKQRLRRGAAERSVTDLVQTMFTEVLSALEQAAELEGIVVVTNDPTAKLIARERGVEVIDDREQGHNFAAVQGILHALARDADRALLVPGDCPMLDPEDVDELIRRRAATPSALIVPDRHGTGTNALLLTPPDAIGPSFGPDSCARHQRIAADAGVGCEVVHVSSLALDIDTPDDLAAMTRARC